MGLITNLPKSSFYDRLKADFKKVQTEKIAEVRAKSGKGTVPKLLPGTYPV